MKFANISPNNKNIGLLFGVSLFDVTFGYHFWTSVLDIIAGHHCWTSLLDVTFGCHFWTSLLGITFGRHFSNSLLGVTLVITTFLLQSIGALLPGELDGTTHDTQIDGHHDLKLESA